MRRPPNTVTYMVHITGKRDVYTLSERGLYCLNMQTWIAVCTEPPRMRRGKGGSHLDSLFSDIMECWRVFIEGQHAGQ